MWTWRFLLFLKFLEVVFSIQPSRGSKLLLLLRPRSRHTSLIYPLDTFTTPLLELQEVQGDKNIHFERLNDLLYTVDVDSVHGSNKAKGSLDVSRCILAHSVHLVHDSSDNPSTLSALPAKSSSSSRKFFISAIILDNPYMTNEAIDKLILQPIITNTFQRLQRVYKEKHAENDLKYRVIVDSRRDKYFLTEQLSRGLASSVDKGEGIREVFASKDANRRPNNGVLKRFSLNRLYFRTKTSLEPEIALLMCSFAKLVPNGQRPLRILDCFCGSCMILLAASIHMTVESSTFFPSSYPLMVGVDANRDVFDLDGIKNNFKHMNKSHIFETQLSLFHGYFTDLMDQDNYSLSYMHGQSRDVECGLFDAIITDPPYDMNERIREEREDDYCRSNNDAFYRAFLIMASKRLKVGGRVVFFYPEVGINHLLHPSICYDDEAMQHFILVHSIRQRFSSTFSRYLLVLEKRQNQD